MLRSLYSGISGMKVNQTKLDVIGNNISNVGTTGFKSSKVKFQDMLSQSVKDAMAPSMNQGGINSRQVGLGVQLASIDTVMTQGMLQPTGRSLDVAIDGDGFFMISKGPEIFADNTIEVSHRPGSHGMTEQSLTTSGSTIMYSRDGSFILDESGNLLTADGYRVMGYGLTNDDNGMGATGQKPNQLTNSGLDFRFGPGSQLNGYKIVLGQVGPGSVTSADIDTSKKLVILNADFSETSTVTKDQVESAINKGLSEKGISQRMYVSGDIASIGDLGTDRISGGFDAAAASPVSVGGMTFKFAPGDNLNNYIIDVATGAQFDGIGGGSVTIVAATATTPAAIQISGSFKDAADLKAQINDKFAPSTPIDSIIGTPSGTAAKSEEIGGGIASQSPGYQKALDLGFGFGPGADLNGYNIVVGTITSGTAPSAEIDTKNKSIIINGDFVTKPAVMTSDKIRNAITWALADKGIKQEVYVSTPPVPPANTITANTTVTVTPLAGTESAVTNGGTPVQSINEDGSINFVDATKKLGAYDGSLKSLKIPDNVRIPGTDEYLRVKSYTIDKTGIINAILENGSVAAVGQLALASFKNPEGLSKNGGNIYTQSANSGEPSVKSGVNTTGEDNSKGFGSSIQGMLEMSNVDLAEQFTDMIVTNRAFQASGKMITTGDEVLQDIINLKR